MLYLLRPKLLPMAQQTLYDLALPLSSAAPSVLSSLWPSFSALREPCVLLPQGLCRAVPYGKHQS